MSVASDPPATAKSSGDMACPKPGIRSAETNKADWWTGSDYEVSATKPSFEAELLSITEMDCPSSQETKSQQGQSLLRQVWLWVRQNTTICRAILASF